METRVYDWSPDTKGKNRTVAIKTRTLIFQQSEHLLTWMKRQITRAKAAKERAQIWHRESSATPRSEEPIMHCHYEIVVGAESGDGEHMGRTNPIPHGTLQITRQSSECEKSIRRSKGKQFNILALIKRLHRDLNTGYTIANSSRRHPCVSVDKCASTGGRSKYCGGWGSTSFPPALVKPDSTPCALHLKHFILTAFCDPCDFQSESNVIAHSF